MTYPDGRDSCSWPDDCSTVDACAQGCTVPGRTVPAWPFRSSESVPAPGSPSPGPAGPATASTAGARGIVAFIRARLEDLAADAGAYHSDGARMPFPPPRCASLDYRGPCDCDEPNRRRRRAFTHGNLVDWAENAYAVAADDGYEPVAVLRHLAAEWSDHPDYDTEWGPLP